VDVELLRSQWETAGAILKESFISRYLEAMSGPGVRDLLETARRKAREVVEVYRGEMEALQREFASDEALIGYGATMKPPPKTAAVYIPKPEARAHAPSISD